MSRLIRLGAKCCALANTYVPMVAILLAVSCTSVPELARAVPAAEQAPVAQITVSTTSAGRISPLLYGVNYVWHSVPADEFALFDRAMRNVARYTLARFPGGWAAEHYDWAGNVEVGGNAEPERPGIDPDDFLATVPQASFVIPSARAIRDPSQTGAVVRLAVALVHRYGGRVKLWEIGNEWWLQRGAKRRRDIREENLAAYAALVAAVAPAMKAANPSIEIYATGDWTEPREFAFMRRLVGPAWSAVDGISVHTYCGTLEPQRLCRDIPERLEAIRSVSGKDRLYDSEWSVGPRRTADDYGIRNANLMVLAIEELAFAHVEAAAYWPPVKSVPGIAFVSNDYLQPFATGLVFGWMSRYYRGQALPTGGDLPAAAAKSADGVTLFIASMNSGHRSVHIALQGTGLSRVVSAAVMFAPDPDDPENARLVRFAALPTEVRHDARGQGWVELQLDPGTPGRGVGWEIARVTLR